MSKTITVTADINAVNTRTSLTSQGSVSAPSRIVPQGMTKIKKIVGQLTSDNLADDGAASAILRLGGSAVLGGEQNIVLGSVGGQTVQSGSDAAPSASMPFVLEDADIDVRPGDTVEIAADLAGVDPGDTSLAVTLIFG